MAAEGLAVALGKQGATIPQIGFGTWESPGDQVGAALEAAIDAGYRHIDCAWIYKNEKAIGEALRKIFASGKVKRSDLFITSKLWNTHKKAAEVEQAARYTIECLGIEYLDLYLVHWPVAWEPVPLDGALWGGEAPSEGAAPGTRFAKAPLHETWAALEALVDAGLIKNIGVSNFGVQLLADLLTYARIAPVCNQVELHPYHAQPELVKACAYFGLTVVAYSPLGTTPQWQKGKPNVREDPVIKRIAEQRGETTIDVIIRWHVQRGYVVLPKSLSAVHIQANLQAASLSPLSDEHFAEINALDKGGPGRYIPGDIPWNSFA